MNPAHHRFKWVPAALHETLAAVSLTVDRGRAARVVADLADLRADDRVVDVGCGTGAAVREACRRGARATGVDPSSQMLLLAHWITALSRVEGTSFVAGVAESLPLPEGSATVLWALSSVHHWGDQAHGLAEARRVLVPGGRLVLAERSVRPGARGLARHGLTARAADALVDAALRAGFVEAQQQIRQAGRRTLVVVTASAAPDVSPIDRSRHRPT